MKILIVEDSATLRYNMCQYITNAGHTPVVAEDGVSALQILDNPKSIGMIIMDVEMPGLDGFETTKCIREIFGDDWIPIIFVTGKNEEEDLRSGIDAGGDDYLIKPISETILQAKIRAMERITVMRDQLNKVNKELTDLSERDSLTRLLNRRTFDQKAEEQWRIATRTSEPLTVLLMDIDHFKAYNDSYGHVAGDECIIQVATAIAESVSRPTDIVARFGGEEFIALLPNTDLEGALHIAERVRTAVEGLSIKHSGSTTNNYTTLSIGGAVVTETSNTRFIEQTNAADKALYAAKQAGRNRVDVRLFVPQTLILIAEPTVTTAPIIDGALQSECSIIQFHNGEQAINAVIRNRPKLIVIDEDLDDMNGLVVAREIRKHQASALTPIVILANNLDSSFAERSRGIDIKVCILKALSKEALIYELNRMLFAL